MTTFTHTKTIVIPMALISSVLAISGRTRNGGLSLGWTAPCGPPLTAPTHYIFSGVISDDLIAVLGSAESLADAVAVASPGAALSISDAQDLLNQTTVSPLVADAVLAELGLVVPDTSQSLDGV